MEDTLTIATAEGVRIYAITYGGRRAYLRHYNQKSGAGSC